MEKTSKETKKAVGAKLKSNLLAILIISFGGAIIYGLPYFRFDYYDVYLEMYGLTNTQMGLFGSVFGIFGMVSYLFGGYVADRFSIKKLIALSLIGTGIGGFIHLLPLGFIPLLALYAFWGFTSLFAFWPACVKAVRMMADPTDQGKAFGWFEGARGIAAALAAMAAVFVFRAGAKELGDAVGIRWLIIFYAVATILAGILVLILMKDEKMNKEDKISFSNLGQVLKLPAVWIIAIVTFCTYTFTMSLYYFTPYATSFLGASAVAGAAIAAARRYVSPISSIGGGFLADKVGTGRLFFVSFLIMAGCTAAMISLPLQASSWRMYIVIFFVNYFFFNVNYSLSWAMLEEGGIPEKFSGTAAGVIATLGYLPEVFCSVLAGSLIDGNTGATGYHYYFYFLIAVLLIGAAFVLVWIKYTDKLKKGAAQAS